MSTSTICVNGVRLSEVTSGSRQFSVSPGNSQLLQGVNNLNGSCVTHPVPGLSNSRQNYSFHEILTSIESALDYTLSVDNTFYAGGGLTNNSTVIFNGELQSTGISEQFATTGLLRTGGSTDQSSESWMYFFKRLLVYCLLGYVLLTRRVKSPSEIIQG